VVQATFVVNHLLFFRDVLLYFVFQHHQIQKYIHPLKINKNLIIKIKDINEIFGTLFRIFNGLTNFTINESIEELNNFELKMYIFIYWLYFLT